MLATDTVAGGWAAGWEPEPDLTVCEWADKHIVLSSKASAEPGQFRSDRTPYVKEILESLSPSTPVQRVVWMAGAQVAKTQTGLNWLGAIMDMWPGPTLLVEPTLELSKKLSKQRIAPMIDGTAVLRAKVAESRSRDSGNTMFEKEFPGGMLIMTGANSASGLRSMPIRYLFMDEVDAYPGDVEGEGSPMDLAEKRTTTFARRKILITSTPTIKGFSAVEREYDKSDKRKYFVPCPHCGEFDTIEWPRIVYDEGDPKSARLVCQHCACLIEERFKTEMLAKGEWRATAVSQNGTRGYHLNGLYSPLGWKSWADCVQEWFDAKDNVEKLKVFVNTVLGETWEERGEGIDPASLKARLETYAAEVPAGARILVSAVDVQGDRLEAIVKAYGAREESWLVAQTQFHGDPGQEDVWNELDEFLQAGYGTAAGGTMYIDTTLIDSGGHHTDTVYRFCKARTARRVYALKGQQQQGKSIVSNPSQNNRYRVKLWLVGVDAAKDLVVSRMKIPRPGPGFMHLPDWVDDEYLAQLTSEKAVRKYLRGRGTVRQWVKTRARNEAFDLEVYALAALYTRGAAYLNKLLHQRTADEAIEAPDTGTEAHSGPVAASGQGEGTQTPTKAPKWGSGSLARTGRWGSGRGG